MPNAAPRTLEEARTALATAEREHRLAREAEQDANYGERNYAEREAARGRRAVAERELAAAKAALAAIESTQAA